MSGNKDVNVCTDCGTVLGDPMQAKSGFVESFANRHIRISGIRAV